MGLGTRIFLVNDEGFLKRFPLAKFERLRKGEECLPQYAGQRIPYVFILLEVQNRKPIGIYKIQYSYLPFDSKGQIDATEREAATMLAVRYPHCPQSKVKGASLGLSTNLPRSVMRSCIGGRLRPKLRRLS